MITCLSDNGRSPVHQLKLADPIMLVAEMVGSKGSLQSHFAEQWMVAKSSIGGVDIAAQNAQKVACQLDRGDSPLHKVIKGYVSKVS